MLLYTDGLVKVFSHEEEMLGVEGFSQLALDSAKLTLPEMRQAILDGVAAWSHGPLVDDVSLVIVEVRQQSQSNEFRPQATERLFLAVVNQAISDVLENGKEAKEAERWLLSKDFEALDNLFACPAKASGIAITKNESAKRLSLTNGRSVKWLPAPIANFRTIWEAIG